MQALVNAGGKGSRMGKCGIEKPMQMVGDKHTVQRVVEALSASSHIDRLLVSVSDNTPETERFLNSIGVETIRTSGESFMDDLHDAFKVMDGDYVLTCPSDLPLLTTEVVDTFLEYFVPGTMDSAIAVVDEETVLRTGITPSYTREDGGRNWVLSGLCIMNRPGATSRTVTRRSVSRSGTMPKDGMRLSDAVLLIYHSWHCHSLPIR